MGSTLLLSFLAKIVLASSSSQSRAALQVREPRRPCPALLCTGNPLTGMLGSIAEQLFARDGPVAAEEADAVRLSWFTVASEAVTDVLANVGGQHTQGLTVQPNMHGHGSAAGVKGLWEVAVTSAGDVSQLVAGVRAKSADGDRDPGQHCVYVFNVYKQGAVMSTVSVVLLGSASAPDDAPGAAADGIMAWVRALQRMLQAGEQHGRRSIQGEVATSSGATTLLAPVLTGSVPGLLLAAVEDDAAAAPSTVATLKFASRLRRIVLGGQAHNEASPAGMASPQASYSADEWEQRSAVPQRPALPAAQRYPPASAAPPTAAATLPMVTPTQHAMHASGSAGGGQRHGEAPWGSVRPSALPSLDEASAMAGRMAQQAAEGDPEARWFMAMLSALEASREQLQRAEGEAQELRGAWEAAVARADAAEEAAAAAASHAAAGRQDDGHGEGSTDKASVRGLRAALKEVRAEVRDYELYRDVMEATMGKLKGEVAKLVAERDDATKTSNKAKAARRKDKGAVASARAEQRDLQAQVDALASELGAERQHTATLRAQLKRQSDASYAALQAAHEEYSSPRQGSAPPQERSYGGSRSGSTHVQRAGLGGGGLQHGQEDTVGDEELMSAVHTVADDVLRVAGAGRASTSGGRAQLASGLAHDMHTAHGGRG